MNYGLDIELLTQINNIFNHYPEIKSVIIFGSRAKGNFKPGSDIDLAIIGNITPTIISQIYLQIDELNSPYKFDLINYNSISNNDLLEHINRIGKTIYSNS